MTTIAGATGVVGYSDGPGAAAQFVFPSDVAADHAGTLYVADATRVRRIDLATNTVSVLAGQPNQPGGQDGIGTAALFNFARGVAVDSRGRVLVADSGSIRQIEPATGAVTTYAGQSARPGKADGIGGAARFWHPTGSLATDGAGNVYVADQDNLTVRKVALATGQVSTTAAGFSSPRGVAWDGAGNLFVTDGIWIRRIAVATGAVTTLAGSTRGNADGTGAAAQFSSLGGLAYDGAGTLYVADTGNNAIRKVAVATGQVTTLLSGLASAFDVTYDGAGTLYAVQVGGTQVYRISTTTPVATPVASSALADHGVWAVAADGAGSLYVSYVSSGNSQPGSVIRKIALASGTASTVVGTPKQQGVLPGPLPASVNQPRGLCWVPGQGLVISDYAENVILLARGL